MVTQSTAFDFDKDISGCGTHNVYLAFLACAKDSRSDLLLAYLSSPSAGGKDNARPPAAMLIDSFAPNPDAVEIDRIEGAASGEDVYHALWTADLGRSPVVKALLALRSLPARVLHSGRVVRPHRKITLDVLIETSFGRLAEEQGREIVLGIAGRFWHLADNVLPFREEDFLRPVAPGIARAVWNFSVEETSAQRTILSTETRIVCGDEGSRLKFRVYWFFVRPFSGLIRIIMLRAIRRACEASA